jgi:transposase-like protein
MGRHREPNADAVRIALQEAGSISGAAIRLGVSRRTLHRWLLKLDIRVERHVVTEVGEPAA